MGADSTVDLRTDALPEDIEALLGEGVSFSIDASADLESAFERP